MVSLLEYQRVFEVGRSRAFVCMCEYGIQPWYKDSVPIPYNQIMT